MSDNYAFRDPQLSIDDPTVVGFYPRGAYALDNFAAYQVYWRGRLWPTSEHAYQAAAHILTGNLVAVEAIATALSSHDAKLIAVEYKAQRPPNWSDIKVGIMEEICRAKLQQHEYVRTTLRRTGNREIVEDSPKDGFWGWGPNRKGRNELGKIWMRLRDELLGATALAGEGA